jgi:hypothetical protein
VGRQVANNRKEHHQLIYKDGGEIEFRPYGLSLIRKQYIPVGNLLIYPATWSKEQAVEVFLNYKIDILEKGINDMNKKFNELKQTKIKWIL